MGYVSVSIFGAKYENEDEQKGDVKGNAKRN
jgi:hypothetical protein